jgi:hypothetical protein
MRREIPLLITGFVGAVYIVSFFIPTLGFVETVTTDWILIIQAFAIWLGALNLLKINLLKLSTGKKDRVYAAVVIASFLVMAGAGFAPLLRGGRDYQAAGSSFAWLFDAFYVPLNATMFALLAFFVASASYRAFRARNKEATLLLLAAFFVMLGRVPLGDLLTAALPDGWRMSSWADVIMNYPQLAGQRAIMIGIALGIVSTSLRLVLGIERSHIGGE